MADNSKNTVKQSTDQQETYVVSGFAFHDRETADKAKKEENAVKYLLEQLKGKDLKTMYSLYNQLTAQNFLSTPVGISFLYDLRQALIQNGSIPEDKVADIDVPSVNGYGSDQNQGDKKSADMLSSIEKAQKNNTLNQIVDNAKNKDYQGKFHQAVTVAVILGAACAAMLVIGLTSKLPTVINYRTQIQNEYADWEDQLDKREEQISEQEQILMDTEGTDTDDTNTGDTDTAGEQDSAADSSEVGN